jgi:hypothetical protein
MTGSGSQSRKCRPAVMAIAVMANDAPVVVIRETPDRSVANHDVTAMVVATISTALAASVETDERVAFMM